MVINPQTAVDNNQAYNLSYLLNVCETTLNENTTEKSARLVVGLDNLENKVQMDREIVNRSETILRDEFMKQLLLRKKEIELRTRDNVKKINNKNLNIATRMLAIEQKIQAIAKRTNSFEVKAKANGVINRDVEFMEEGLGAADKDIEEIKFLTGGQSDSYLSKDNGKTDIKDESVHRVLNEVDRPSILAFAERLRNSLKLLEDVIVVAEGDVAEVSQGMKYKFM